MDIIYHTRNGRYHSWLTVSRQLQTMVRPPCFVSPSFPPIFKHLLLNHCPGEKKKQTNEQKKPAKQTKKTLHLGSG